MESDYRYKDFTVVNSRLLEKNTILEISFEYLERIDYISKNYIPKSVYTLKSGFFWLDKKNQLVVIKCQNTSINEAIISFLGEYFNTKYWKFSLRKDIVDDIFDKTEMIKNSLIANKNTDPDLFNSIVIKDIEFERKSKDPRFKFIVLYERRSSSYRTIIKGFQNKVNVSVAENGKISLIGKSIKIDRCREWLINILVQVLAIHQKYLDSSDISSIIRTSDFIERTSLFKKVKNKKAREKIFELIEKIILLKNNPTVSNVEYYFPTDYAYYFREYLIPLPDLRCSKDECNTCLLCPNEACDSFKFEIKTDIKKREFYLKCSKCYEVISQTQDLECIDNHNFKFNLEDSITYILKLKLKLELNNILHGLNTGFEIKNNIETFYIKENKLYRKENLDKIVYSWDELLAFRDIPKLEDLSNEIKKAQARRVTEILEKCNKRKGECRNCHLNEEKENICLLRIFAEYSNGQAHPHTGTEFGDFEFPQKFSTGIENIIGIAKSYGKKPTSSSNPQKIFGIEFRLLTFKDNDNLLEQFFQLSMEDSIRFIMIVSGRVIDSGLKNSLIEIARWKLKRIVFIEPKELIPIFSYYFKDLVNK